MRISDWSSEVCSSDLRHLLLRPDRALPFVHAARGDSLRPRIGDLVGYCRDVERGNIKADGLGQRHKTDTGCNGNITAAPEMRSDTKWLADAIYATLAPRRRFSWIAALLDCDFALRGAKNLLLR